MNNKKHAEGKSASNILSNTKKSVLLTQSNQPSNTITQEKTKQNNDVSKSQTKLMTETAKNAEGSEKINHKTRKLFNGSLREMQMNILNSLTKYNFCEPKKTTIEIQDFQKYSDKMESTLNYYQLTSTNLKDFDYKTTNPNEKFISKKDKNIVKKIYDMNKSYNNHKSNYKNDDTNLKISVNNVDYPDAYHSLGVIKHNQYLYNEISKDILMRQKDLFDNSISLAYNHIKKYKVKMPKVQVTGAIPKMNFDIPVVDMTDDRKKKELSILPPINVTKGNLKLFSYYRYPNKNFPEGREQFSICMKNNSILISGGIGVNMKQMNLWSLNLEKLEWKKIITKSQTNNRFGHTALFFQNKLFIFGGRTKYSSTSIICGFEILNFSDDMYSTPIMGKIVPENRRNHISVLVGQQILIYGGITENNSVLNDCYLLNVNPLKWTLCSISKFTPAPFLYGHSACLVVPGDMAINHRFTVYSFPTLEIGKNNLRIKEKGLYVFGGKTKDDKLSNQLWIMIMGKKPCEWVQPELNGTPPSPRYFHSMNFYEKGNFIIIHGGRNDDISVNFGLNDTYILDLENFDWMNVELYSQLEEFKVLSRCGHQSMIYGNKLIILGGMNNSNYLGSTLFIVNLDFNYSTISKTSEEMMIKELQKKEKDDPEARRKIMKLKSEIRKNQLGLVTALDLPPIQ